MTYKEKEELIEAAKILKEYCNEKCTDCIFGLIHGCSINDKVSPKYWDIPKISRWTPEDVALAKALKDFGFSLIIRNDVGSIYYSDEDGGYYRLPRYAFKNIGYSENVLIDTIIKEGEEDV